MKRDSGFTLVEVLVALLLGAVGLLGTLAVQQAVIGASKAANDSAVALRLASQRLEEFSSQLTTGDPANAPTGVVGCAPPTAGALPFCDQMRVVGTGAWSSGECVDAEGLISGSRSALGGTDCLPTPQFRWVRRWRVVNTGFGLPYVISVAVTYATDTGTPKTVRLDVERRKSWQ
jgi:prepilin-type N-terminal cleavage/methylation domain-containing protein